MPSNCQNLSEIMMQTVDELAVVLPITEFYFDNCQLYYESYCWSVRICMPIDLKQDIDKVYGYNKNISNDFLRE
jgi:hypothetical protein